jgi:hypothetical protein
VVTVVPVVTVVSVIRVVTVVTGDSGDTDDVMRTKRELYVSGDVSVRWRLIRVEWW